MEYQEAKNYENQGHLVDISIYEKGVVKHLKKPLKDISIVIDGKETTIEKLVGEIRELQDKCSALEDMKKSLGKLANGVTLCLDYIESQKLKEV